MRGNSEAYRAPRRHTHAQPSGTGLRGRTRQAACDHSIRATRRRNTLRYCALRGRATQQPPLSRVIFWTNAKFRATPVNFSPPGYANFS